MAGGKVDLPKGVVVPDGGWGWLVVLSSFVLQFLTIGITYTFGVILVALVDEKKGGFGEGESTTAWIGSIQPFFLYSTGLVSGPMIKRFGWRVVTISGAVISAVGFIASAYAPNVYVLYLTYGGLTGIGNGFMYVTSMVAVQHYFDTKRALATGIAVSGSGFGTLVFGYLLQYMIDEIGWRKTMAAEAGIICLGIFCGALLRPLERVDVDDDLISESEQEQIHSSNNSLPSVEYKRLGIRSRTVSLMVDDDEPVHVCCGGGINCGQCKNPAYLMFCVTIVCFCCNLHVPYTYTPERAVKQYDIDSSKAAFLVSIMGIANVCSRLAFGWIGDRSESMRLGIASAMLFAAGLISVLMPVLTTYPLMVLFAIVFGAGTGCFASLFPVILVDLVGVEGIETSLGQSMAVGSFVFLIASPLSGLLIESTGTEGTGNFNTPYILVGAIGIFGSLMLASIRFVKKRPSVGGYEEITDLRPGSPMSQGSARSTRERSHSTTSRLRYMSESFS